MFGGLKHVNTLVDSYRADSSLASRLGSASCSGLHSTRLAGHCRYNALGVVNHWTKTLTLPATPHNSSFFVLMSYPVLILYDSLSVRRSSATRQIVHFKMQIMLLTIVRMMGLCSDEVQIYFP